MLSHTRKPIIFVTPGFEGCVDCVQMAEVVAGGLSELRRNPFVGCYINVSSDLKHNKEALQKLLFLAEKGIPTTYTSDSQRGATSPVTRAGALALTGAGHMVGLVLSQLVREGTPFIWGAWQQALDLRTQIVPYADPDMKGLGAAQAHHYGLPYFGMAGCSDAKVLDAQAGAEAGMSLLIDALSGANLIHDLGYLESGLTGSLQLLVICDELVGWIRSFMQGTEVSEGTLAVDIIDEVGPDGHFLETEHTLKHFNNDWHSKLFDRQNHEIWAQAGRKSIVETSAEKVTELLNSKSRVVLDRNIRNKIRGIRERAEAEALVRKE